MCCLWECMALNSIYSLFVLAPLPAVRALLQESVTQQVYSPADLLTSDKPLQFCAHLRGFLADPPLTLILLSATDVIIPRTEIN